MVVQDQLELVIAHRHQGLDHLTIVQPELAGHWRFHISGAHVHVNRRHTRDRVDAFGAEDGHGNPLRGSAPSFCARSCLCRRSSNHRRG